MTLERKRAKRWIQVGIYLLLLSYFLADFYAFDGPVSRLFLPAPSESAAATEVVARVHGRPITHAQLEHALQVHAFERGIDLQSLNPVRQDELRRSVLLRLVDDALLRAKIEFASEKPALDEQRIEREWKEWCSRFRDEAELDSVLERHGLSRIEMRQILVARLQQERFLRRLMNERIKVGDDEIEAFYKEHCESLARSPQLHLRHLFAASLDHPEGQEVKLVESWSERIESGAANWDQLALESEDLASASAGGDLGWVARERLPKDFTDAVFAMKKGESGLVRSSLGAHWVEVLDARPARIPPLDEVADEIRETLWLEASRAFLKNFRLSLRRDAMEDGLVLIFSHAMKP